MARGQERGNAVTPLWTANLNAEGRRKRCKSSWKYWKKESARKEPCSCSKCASIKAERNAIMINITKFAVGRPATIVLCLLTIAYFGIQSLMGTSIELTPEMGLPMLVVGTVYAGASPDDIQELNIQELDLNAQPVVTLAVSG